MDAEKGLSLNLHSIAGDLNEMILKLSPFSMEPILTVIFSNIDFLGGLIEGFNRYNSRKRSIRFMTEFMSEINIKYKNETFAIYLYENVRNILIHESIARKFSSSHNYAEKRHLMVIQLDEFDTLFIHPAEFKKEFLKGLEIFQKKIESDIDFKHIILKNFQNLFNINYRFTDEELNILQLEKIDTNEMSISDLRDFTRTKKTFN